HLLPVRKLDGADQVAVARLAVVLIAVGRVAERVEIDPELAIEDGLQLPGEDRAIVRATPTEVEVLGGRRPVAVASRPEIAPHRAARRFEADGLVGQFGSRRAGRRWR